MSKVKKILAVILSMAMVLGMSMTTFAEEEQPTTSKKPTADNTATATVTNVEAGATVKAYQIVKANYNDSGFTGYSAVEGVTIADPVAPTSDEVTAIAQEITKLGLTAVSMTPSGTEGLVSYTAKLNAGYWMVLVEKTDKVEEVYNPMLIGVYYSVSGNDDTMLSGSVDANSNWTLVTTNAYAKSTKPTIDKKIVGSGSNNASGDDVAIGDTVDFEISTAIPSYSDQYTSVKVEITDTLSAGLTLVVPEDNTKLPVTVKVGGTEATAGDDTYSYAPTANGFKISFASTYALANSGKEVVVTYQAKLNDKAGLNFDPNTNTAKLEYSNNPQNSDDTDSTEDVTYTYTFAIDSKLYGESIEEWNKKVTEELLKTGEKKTVIIDGEEVEVAAPLEGAEFTLYKSEDGQKGAVAGVKESDADGALSFTGLDAGKYILQETKAPEGYSLNEAEIPVEITAEYNEDGTLKSYTILVNNEATSTYSATYKGETIVKEVEEVTIIKAEKFEIQNTKIGSLPSTGGIGTTIFTIGGVVLMIGAAALFFATRKKYAK